MADHASEMGSPVVLARNNCSPIPHSLIGWREWLTLPELGIPAIKAKVDTGARTSALHATSTELLQRDGISWVQFQVYPLPKRNDTIIYCAAPLLDQRLVRDSGGHQELRYVIATRLRIGQLEQIVELTLTARNNMLFRMLVGRTAIRDHFLVDPAASYLVSARPCLATIYPEAKL